MILLATNNNFLKEEHNTFASDLPMTGLTVTWRLFTCDVIHWLFYYFKTICTIFLCWLLLLYDLSH